ncbi:alpha/beta fold hydrolase [Streptomyces noursei]|uniref:alpha/beta fold hydrolase n=1 Tax=Streptomyces noursei TaxID=1971 RepID=UPI0016737DF6|nr:alpha/beta hydrolase [Streptomyces noursei]MCZ1021165.1 alpha/beta hydrolase [Streptomyces noursei]GGX54085.1 alpha/beta hydrolase [Streptomyces noursei]
MSARRNRIELPAGSFHYRTWGETGPAAVLLHGNAASSASWERVGPELAARMRVSALDLRGHGDSVRPPAGAYQLAEAAADVADFTTALGLRHPLLVGHSWGAAVALTLAARPDADLGGLVLEDPPPQMSVDALHTHINGLIRAGELPPGALLETVAVVHPGWHPDDVRTFATDLSHAHPDVIRALVADGARSGPLLLLLANSTAPVLLLRADPRRGGLLDDTDFARACRLLPPHSKAVDLPGVSHEIHRAAFEDFTRALLSFAAHLPHLSLPDPAGHPPPSTFGSDQRPTDLQRPR